MKEWKGLSALPVGRPLPECLPPAATLASNGPASGAVPSAPTACAASAALTCKACGRAWQDATQTAFLELLGRLRDQKKTKLTILLLGARSSAACAAPPCAAGTAGEREQAYTQRFWPLLPECHASSRPA